MTWKRTIFREIRKAGNPFVGQQNTEQTRRNLEEALTKAVYRITNDVKVRPLYERLPWRCKAGYYLLNKIRIPFLEYLLDAVWFGGHAKRDVRRAKQIMVGEFYMTVPINVIKLQVKLTQA